MGELLAQAPCHSFSISCFTFGAQRSRRAWAGPGEGHAGPGRRPSGQELLRQQGRSRALREGPSLWAVSPTKGEVLADETGLEKQGLMAGVCRLAGSQLCCPPCLPSVAPSLGLLGVAGLSPCPSGSLQQGKEQREPRFHQAVPKQSSSEPTRKSFSALACLGFPMRLVNGERARSVKEVLRSPSAGALLPGPGRVPTSLASLAGAHLGVVGWLPAPAMGSSPNCAGPFFPEPTTVPHHLPHW